MATLGYTTNGASTDYDPQDYGQWAGPYTMPEDGTGVSMSLYATAKSSGNVVCRLAIFTDSSGVPGAQITNGITPEITIAGGSGTALRTGTFTSGPTLTNGSKYWLLLWFGSGWASPAGFKYDSPGGTQSYYHGAYTYSSTGNAPNYPGSGTSSGEKISLYVTYTPSGGGTVTFSLATTGASAPAFTVTKTAKIAVAATGVSAPAFTVHKTAAVVVAATGVSAPSFTLTATHAVSVAATGTSVPSFGVSVIPAPGSMVLYDQWPLVYIAAFDSQLVFNGAF